MPTIYLPNTQEVQDLLTVIEDVHPKGQFIYRECLEVQTENASLAAFLKSLNITNPNGASRTGEIPERTCKRCKKQFDPTRPNQYTCSKCLADIARKRTSGKNGQGSPVTIAPNPHDAIYYGTVTAGTADAIP